MNGNVPERRKREVRDRRDPLRPDRRAAGLGSVVYAAAGLASAAARAAAEAAGLGGRRVNPIAEEAYWRANHAAEPYYDARFSFNDYYPAYRAGWEGRMRHRGRTFEEVERELEADFNWNRGNSLLTWETARPAVRAAWDRAA